MHPLILTSFLKHCYRSPGSAECLHLLIKPSFFSSFPPSMLHPLSRKQGKGPTVTKILTAVTLLVSACAYVVDKKQRNLCWKLNHFLVQSFSLADLHVYDITNTDDLILLWQHARFILPLEQARVGWTLFSDHFRASFHLYFLWQECQVTSKMDSLELRSVSWATRHITWSAHGAQLTGTIRQEKEGNKRPNEKW